MTAFHDEEENVSEQESEHGPEDGGDAVRARVDAGALEDRAPFDELSRPWAAVPRSALGAIRLELDEIGGERPLEPGKGGLDPVGGMAERRASRAGRRRHRVPAPPALEQPAERDRGRLARAELADEPQRRTRRRRVRRDHVCPAGH